MIPMRSRQSLPFHFIPGFLLACLCYASLIPVAAAQTGDTQKQSRLADEANTIEIANQASGSVVAVNISGVNGDQMVNQGPQQGGGSGFVVDEQGRIVTNFHVIAAALESIDDAELGLAEGARITVSYVGDRDAEHEARIVGANPDVDLALLELSDSSAVPDVPALPLGDSDQVVVGEKVIVIGNPFGLHSSLTTGVVSAVERERPGLVGIEIPYIQTDAAINPGNSGGPLLNSSGEVTGISNAVLGPIGTFAGIGLAVPSNLLRDNLDQLRSGGLSGIASEAMTLPERPRLGLQTGMSVEDLPPPVRSRLELPDQGVLVTGIAEGGPADEAGLRGPQEMVALGPYGFPIGMDVITAAEGEPVRRAIDLQRIVLQHQDGDEVTLDVWRNGETRQVDVELEIVPVSQ